MASTYLHRTMGSGDRNKWTLSVWLKKCKTGDNQRIITVSDNATYDDNLRFDADDKLLLVYNNATVFMTNRRFRDKNAWYHICLKVDTAQSSANDRVVLYVNGVDERSTGGYSTDSMPSQSQDGYINHNVQHVIGMTNPTAASNFFDGCMSHYHFTDGYAYTASTFGSTDSTTGEWKINTSPSITMGTNGFTIMKDGNTITDQSSNSNDFTLGAGTLTKTEDNPSNVFDTLNTNIAVTGGVAGRDGSVRIFYENGNTRMSTDVALWSAMLGSIPMTKGKYYFECMRTYEGSPSNHLAWIGIEEISTAGTNLGSPAGTNTNAIGYYSSDGGTNKSNSGTGNSYGTWSSNNDIAMCAIDLDNNFIYFGVNGTWGNSCNPESGGSGTGGIAITAGKTYVTAMTVHRGGGSAGGDKSMLKFNFGNGYFQTTQVASAGTNASGLGIFEYNVPAGYSAICTKGLNE